MAPVNGFPVHTPFAMRLCSCFLHPHPQPLGCPWYLLWWRECSGSVPVLSPGRKRPCMLNPHSSGPRPPRCEQQGLASWRMRHHVEPSQVGLSQLRSWHGREPSPQLLSQLNTDADVRERAKIRTVPADPHAQTLKRYILLSHGVLWFVMQHHRDHREPIHCSGKAEGMER